MYNHYAKLKTLIETYPDYRIIKIDQPTTTKRFNGEYNFYDHYYRLVDSHGQHIKYGKFQQLDKLASVLKVDVKYLETKIINDNHHH